MTTAVDPGPEHGAGARRTACMDVAPASVSGPARRGSRPPERHQAARALDAEGTRARPPSRP